MPTYRITDQSTGRTFRVTGSAPPDETFLRNLRSEAALWSPSMRAAGNQPGFARHAVGELASGAGRALVGAGQQIGDIAGGLWGLGSAVVEDAMEEMPEGAHFDRTLNRWVYPDGTKRRSRTGEIIDAGIEHFTANAKKRVQAAQDQVALRRKSGGVGLDFHLTPEGREAGRQLLHVVIPDKDLDVFSPETKPETAGREITNLALSAGPTKSLRAVENVTKLPAASAAKRLEEGVASALRGRAAANIEPMFGAPPGERVMAKTAADTLARRPIGVKLTHEGVTKAASEASEAVAKEIDDIFASNPRARAAPEKVAFELYRRAEALKDSTGGLDPSIVPRYEALIEGSDAMRKLALRRIEGGAAKVGEPTLSAAEMRKLKGQVYEAARDPAYNPQGEPTMKAKALKERAGLMAEESYSELPDIAKSLGKTESELIDAVEWLEREVPKGGSLRLPTKWGWLTTAGLDSTLARTLRATGYRKAAEFLESHAAGLGTADDAAAIAGSGSKLPPERRGTGVDRRLEGADAVQEGAGFRDLDEYVELRRGDRRRALQERYPKADPAQLDDHAAALEAAESHPVSGLPNRRAMQTDAAKGDHKAWASSDLSGFKKVNDEFGHLAGDAALRHIADAFVAEAKQHPSVRVYHIGGDEYVASAVDDAAAKAFMDAVKRRAASQRVRYEAPDGTLVEFDPPGVDYGLGADYGRADAALKSSRTAAERAGTRVTRAQREAGGRDVPAVARPVSGVAQRPAPGRQAVLRGSSDSRRLQGRPEKVSRTALRASPFAAELSRLEELEEIERGLSESRSRRRSAR